MPNYTLYYFNARARGEIIRLIFAVAGVDYKDVRVEMEKWPEMKSKAPFGQMPFMEIDGVKVCQSLACARYLARKYNLAGKSDMEQLQADMIVDCLNDACKMAPQIFFEKDETKKAALMKKYLEEDLPTYLKHLEALLISNQGGDKYFVGNELTWADLWFLCFISFLGMTGGSDQVDKYPKLKALQSKVEKLPKIADWLAKRPKTDL